MTKQEREKAQPSLMVLTQNWDDSMQGGIVYVGKHTTEWIQKKGIMSPAAALESIVLTALTDRHKKRDVMTRAIPNAFIQAEIAEVKQGEERVMMMITGVLVDLLFEVHPSTLGPTLVFQNKKIVIYVRLLKAIYSMMIPALLMYIRIRSNVNGIGFKINPYDSYVANRTKKGSQQTAIFYVDDLKSTPKLLGVNDNFKWWLNIKFGEHGQGTTRRQWKHNYMGMVLDYSNEKEVKPGMKDCAVGMLETFPIKYKPNRTAVTSVNENLF